MFGVYEDFGQSLAAQGIKIAERFGDPNDHPSKLVIVFGRGASLADLRSIVAATGPSKNVYIAAVEDESFEDTIIVGAEGGGGQKSAKLPDVYPALQGAESLEEFANEVIKKGKPHY